MFSESSSPYNSLEYLKYGGRTTLPSVGVHGIRRALRHLKGVRARSSPRRGASLGPWEGVFGGRARRRRPRKRATRKQLLALAKGRAKLARMRRHGRRTRRGGKAGKRKFLADLNDFYRPKKVHLSQETCDDAALKGKKILVKLRNDYGLGTDYFQALPEVYHLTKVLNKCYRTIQKCVRAGYDPVYGWPGVGEREANQLQAIQDINLEAKARKGGDRMALKNVVRKMWMNAHPGRAADMTEINRLLREAKTGAYRDLMDAEYSNVPMNMFKEPE